MAKKKKKHTVSVQRYIRGQEKRRKRKGKRRKKSSSECVLFNGSTIGSIKKSGTKNGNNVPMM
jgi:hypothetical protein